LLVGALAAGVAALALRPGLEGLLVASLCHALAWGLAWRLALAATGPTALMVVHAMLGSIALAGAIVGAARIVKSAPEIPR
ncbi:MAG: hypothetical protein IH627_17680, partial [Rubrivivax sp.]|nr:hypothetical protein [Rubrivivax sp.]